MDEKITLIREAGRRYLDAFCLAVDEKFQLPFFIKKIISELEKIEKGENKRLMIFLPPRHGKSLLSSVYFPTWVLGRNPDKEIIVASYSAELAGEFGLKARDVVSLPVYNLIFEHKLRDDISAKTRWSFENSKGGYTAVGFGGSITGRGADILIIDDPIKSREEAESETFRNKVYEYYTSVLRTRLSPGGAIILIQTRWHLDDLAGRILKNEDNWKVIKYPAIATEDEKWRKQGEPLWGERFSLEEINEIKKNIGTYNFSALYQQEPISSENQEFKKHWIRYRSIDEVSKLETSRYLTIDPAMGKGEENDYTGFVRNFVDQQNKWNILSFRAKLTPTELVDKIFELYKLDRYEKIGIEETQYTIGLKPFLDDEMRRRNIFLPIVPLKHKGIKKEIRIRGLIPRFESGSVFLIEKENEALEEEMLTFPVGKHDDILDALAYQLEVAQPPVYNLQEIQKIYERRNNPISFE